MKSTTQTAKALLENWDRDKEDFLQVLHGIQVTSNEYFSLH